MNSSGTVTALNVFAPDGLCARQVGCATTEYVFDQQGNVADRTDTSGTTQSITQYDAWGNEQTISGTPTDPFGYNAQSGYYLDRETGLYLCQHRFYDPANGRWLNRDPIGHSGGTNLYAYCAGGPIESADPTGKRMYGFGVGFGWMFPPVSASIFAGLGYDPDSGHVGILGDGGGGLGVGVCGGPGILFFGSNEKVNGQGDWGGESAGFGVGMAAGQATPIGDAEMSIAPDGKGGSEPEGGRVGVGVGSAHGPGVGSYLEVRGKVVMDVTATAELIRDLLKNIWAQGNNHPDVLPSDVPDGDPYNPNGLYYPP